MVATVFFIFQVLMTIGTIIASFLLIRNIYRALKSRRIFKGIVLSLVTIIVIAVAIFFMLVVLGGIVNIVKT